MMVLSLHSRFLTAEQQLLSAFAAGEDSLVAFADMWATLLSDFGRAKEMHHIDFDMSCLAHSVASRVSILTDSLLSLDTRANELRDKFSIQFTAILSTADMEEAPPTTIPTSSPPSTPPSPTNRDISSPPTPTDIPTSPRHILHGSRSLHCLAGEWLLENVHDPYPSSTLKTLMAEECRCSIKDVQDWFRDARRSIGWSALLQDRFQGSRRAISDAATRAYRIYPDHTLPPDIITAFIAIKTNACDYKSGSCRCCSGDRSGAMNPLSDDSGVTSLVSFPSPQSSVSFFSGEEGDTSQPLPVAGCKRRVDSSLDHHSEGTEHSALPDFDAARSVKRRRCTPPANANVQLWDKHQFTAPTSALMSDYRSHSDISPSVVHIRGSPQPPDSTTPESSFDSVTASCDPLGSAYSISASCPSTGIRKRRLSDATLPRLSKRPRGPMFGPRKQTVSDPLPVCLNPNQTEVLGIDDWLRSSWDIPEAIDAGNSDPSLFNVELAAYPAVSRESTSSLSSPVCYIDVPDADLVSATCDGFDFSAFDLSELQTRSNLDFSDDLSVTPSVGSSCSSPSINTPPELSESAPIDNPSHADWSQDWSQFVDLLNFLDSSPASSEISLSDCTSSSQTSNFAPLSNLDDVTDTLFGVDPSFTSLDHDHLSDIGGFSSLDRPLEAIF